MIKGGKDIVYPFMKTIDLKEESIHTVDGKLYPVTTRHGTRYIYMANSVFEELEGRSGTYKETKHCIRVGIADITIYTMHDIERMARSHQSVTIVSYKDRIPLMSTIRFKD